MATKKKPKLASVGLTTTYKFDILGKVAKSTIYKFSIHEIKDEVKKALQAAGVKNVSELIVKNQKQITELQQELSETKRDAAEYKKTVDKLADRIEGLEKLGTKTWQEIGKGISLGVYEQSHKLLNTKPEPDKTVVYFSKEGDLYLDQEKQHCYKMADSHLRVDIVRTLAVSDGYIKPDTLVKLLNTTQSSLEYAVNRIKALSKKYLKGIKVVDGRRSSGYRINPQIAIQQV